MINARRIDEAAGQHAKETWAFDVEQFAYMGGFSDGARWAEEEIRHTLWHDAAKEKPEVGRFAFVAFDNPKKITPYKAHSENSLSADWKTGLGFGLKWWCYADEIMPND